MINPRITNMLNELFNIADLERPTHIKAHCDCDCGVKYNRYEFQSEDENNMQKKCTVFAIMIAPYSKEEVRATVDGKNVLEVTFGGTPSCLAKYEDNAILSNIDFSTRTFRYQLGDNINKGGIKAWSNDGMLFIDVPYIVEEEQADSQTISID
jgi:HSP20 family molecular chaperone IbpA